MPNSFKMDDENSWCLYQLFVKKTSAVHRVSYISGEKRLRKLGYELDGGDGCEFSLLVPWGAARRCVVPLLVARDHQVTALGRTSEKRAVLERMVAIATQVNFFDSDQVCRTVAAHDAGINLGTSIQASSPVFPPGVWQGHAHIRWIVSDNLVKAGQAGGVPRFVQEAFALAYPDRRDEWVEERTLRLSARYSQSLLSGEIPFNCSRRDINTSLTATSCHT